MKEDDEQWRKREGTSDQVIGVLVIFVVFFCV
jgi:hypothetical protein